MKNYLYGTGLFIIGLIVGWLNPIEGPLDWTYDEYASRPAHKSPVKAAPPSEEKEEIPFIWIFEDENIFALPPLIEIQQDEE